MKGVSIMNWFFTFQTPKQIEYIYVYKFLLYCSQIRD
uniref:Uncharacterized protein n=1 Tax=Arundo donax TaxID=35708 RepID=A0A0A9HEC2_ARUDO